jgi:hypothetical protein
MVISLSILLLFLAVNASAKDEDPADLAPYQIPVTDGQIRIDGALDDIPWRDALVVELKYEISPSENTPPPVKTEAYLTHSLSTLYIGFKAFDPNPTAIRAHLSDRDETYGDDAVIVMLDTFNDELRAFEFECNPLGIQRDATRNDAGGGRNWGDDSWDAIWDSAGRITEEGYVVEMAIPFNALSFPRSSGEQTWGLMLSRDYPRSVRHEIRNVPEDRSRNCNICQSSKMLGFQGITPGRNMEFTPTITGFRYDERDDFPAGDMLEQSSNAEVGLTTRWGFTPNFNLFVALNPDFSQVEADAYQLEVNRQFALRYREKRPFFLEGRDFFNTPINAVYTRAVVDPRYGTKLTGKEGANALGVYFARDAVTHLIFPGSQGSESETLPVESTAAVVRYRRDVLNNSAIGFLVTDREGGDYSNRVFGVDGRLRLTSTDTVTFQVLGSSTKDDVPLFTQLMEADEEESDDGDGLKLAEENAFDWAHDFDYEHQTRDWEASFSHSRMGRDYRADLGHVSRVGFERYSFRGGPTWYGDSSSAITRFSVDGSYRQINELNLGLLERQLDGGFWMRGAMQSSLSYDFSVKRQRYEDIMPDLVNHRMRGSLRPSAAVDVEMNLSYGDAIDYTHAREGSRLSLSPEVDLRLGKHLQIEYEHEYTRFNVEGDRLYLANVSQARFIYQFNPRMFVRSILQYIDIRKNQDLYLDEIDPVSRQLFTQLLFSYKVNPRTVVYLGYSDNHQAYQDIDFTQSDRTVFMKISYAWVL